MKKACRYLVIPWLACFLYACSPLEIDFNNPQDVNPIQEEYLFEINGVLNENNDLIALFGEENINFGPVPPTWGDSICFKVDGMTYDTCVRFIYDINHDGDIIPSYTPPPDFDATINVHLFYDKDQGVFKHEMKTRDPYANIHVLELEKAYIIGHDNLFTTYYQGKTIGNGNPTILMIFSGTMVFDQKTGEFIGVSDYIFGRKILDYEYQPTNAFAPGTIEIKRHEGLSPKCNWNDL